MSGVLTRILESKRAEILALPRAPHAPRASSTDRVPAALRRPAGAPLRLVTEIKLRSPSAGALSTVLSPADRAIRYAHGGAVMVSVLCDAPFFGGSWDHVGEVRRALTHEHFDTLILAKEFVIDEVQLDMAAAKGADAVLLIARIVGRKELRDLTNAARARGLEPLVEVVTEQELEAALEAGARCIGVNARDLDTLAMDPAAAGRVLAAIPPDRVAVHLSGVKGPDEVRRLAGTRADAALIGETLMRQDDPTELLRSLFDASTEK